MGRSGNLPTAPRMLLGAYDHTLDDKNRLTLPAKFREAFLDGVVVTRGLDGCLYAFRREDWDRLVDSRMKRLTIRSSSEWKLITASRPPGRSIAKADGSAASSEPSSSLTAIRRAWNTRFAGCPSPKRAGAGIAALIVSTRSPVLSNGTSFLRRTIAFAICRAYRSSP